MPQVYGFCEGKCKYPVYTQDQVMSILQQAIEAGSLDAIDPALAPVVTKIVEQNTGKELSVWMGTEAQFNALSPKVAAQLVVLRVNPVTGYAYLCTDDTTIASILAESAAAAQQYTNTAIDDAKAFIMGLPALKRREMFTESCTWTAPANIVGNKVMCQLFGGGSGGAGGYKRNDSYGYGGGGGAGGYMTMQVHIVEAGKQYDIVIGAGGAGGTYGQYYDEQPAGRYGGAGGTSSFNGQTAAGGKSQTKPWDGADGGSGGGSVGYHYNPNDTSNPHYGRGGIGDYGGNGSGYAGNLADGTTIMTKAENAWYAFGGGAYGGGAGYFGNGGKQEDSMYGGAGGGGGYGDGGAGDKGGGDGGIAAGGGGGYSARSGGNGGSGICILEYYVSEGE